MAEDEEPEPTRQQRCHSCGALSPAAQMNYTLISPKHAWRMVIELQPDGTRTPAWYCPKCWERQKRKTPPGR